jgi:hypothetical protein
MEMVCAQVDCGILGSCATACGHLQLQDNIDAAKQLIEWRPRTWSSATCSKE